MTVYDLAEAHCAHLTAGEQELYMVAFNAGLTAARNGGEAREALLSLIDENEPAWIAGFAEGCAAANRQRPDLTAALARSDMQSYRRRRVAA
jgi:hypothetical protein